MARDGGPRSSDVEWLDFGPDLPGGSSAWHWRRWLTLLVAALVLGAGMVVVSHRHGKRSAVANGPSSAASAPAVGSSPARSSSRAWPTATGGCGEQAYLPLISSALPLAERTGLQVSLGPQLDTVDVDQGRVRPQANFRLAAGEVVSQLVSDGSASVALIKTCDQSAPSRVVRVDEAGQAHQVTAGHFDGLLAGGRHPWAYQFPADNNEPPRLDPLNGSPLLTLPAGFGVVGAYRDLIVGYAAPPTGSDPNSSGPLVILNPSTGRIEAQVGPGTAAATVSAGLVLWTDGACSPAPRCVVHRYDLATGASSSRAYHLGLSTDAYLGYGLISPDHRLLAFQLHRSAPDPRFDQGHPGGPSDIAVLHLDTGQLQTVPGIELWAKASPGLVFSPDSRWLIIGLDEGTRTGLLLWHPGLSHPATITQVPGLTMDTTPIAARLTDWQAHRRPCTGTA